MKIFIPWKKLTEARRGWAVGSIFGLLATTLAYGAIPAFQRYGSVYFFNLHSLPSIPGVLFSEKILIWAINANLQINYAKLHFLQAFIACLINYPLWGAYFAIIFKHTEQPTPFHFWTMLFFLMTFFSGMITVTYTLRRGMVLAEFSPAFYLFIVGFILTLLSLGVLMTWLLDSREVSKIPH